MDPFICFDVFTLLPEVIEPYVQTSILHKAAKTT